MSTTVNITVIDGEEYALRADDRFVSQIGKKPFEQVEPLARSIESATQPLTWRQRLSSWADAALVTMANYGPPATASFAGYNLQLQADAVERRLARQHTVVFGEHAGYGQQSGR